MCGRFTLLADELAIKERFGLEGVIDTFEPSYNIAPTERVFAIIHDGKRRRAGTLQWGLVPHWAKDERIGSRMINARSETAHEKPSFKQLMARKRCLIIADSFYEWEQSSSARKPQRIYLESSGLFAFAGLWDKWQKDDKVLFTCTLLTKDATEDLQHIHHRMPIILPEDKEDTWIQPSFQTAKEAQQFITNINYVPLSYYEVGTYVNNARNKDAACIAPVET